MSLEPAVEQYQPFATAPGSSGRADGNGIFWTNEGQVNANGTAATMRRFPVPSAIVDSNSNVQILTLPLGWLPNTSYAASAYVYDAELNVQFNTGVTGTSSGAAPAFATTPGGTVSDGTGIVWTNEGVDQRGWVAARCFPTLCRRPLSVPGGVFRVLNGASTFTAGAVSPVWSTVVGGTTLDGVSGSLGRRVDLCWTCAKCPDCRWDPTLHRRIPFRLYGARPSGNTTLDGNPPVSAWTCVGPQLLEIEVTPGLAVDRIRSHDRCAAHRVHPHPAVAQQPESLSDLNSFLWRWATSWWMSLPPSFPAPKA